MYGNPHPMYQQQQQQQQQQHQIDAAGYTLQTLGAAPMGGANGTAGSMAPPSWTGAPSASGGMIPADASNVTATPPSGDTSEESGDDSNSMAQVITKVCLSLFPSFFLSKSGSPEARKSGSPEVRKSGSESLMNKPPYIKQKQNDKIPEVAQLKYESSELNELKFIFR